MTMPWDFLMQLLSVVLVAGATYGAIKSDIASLHTRAARIEEEVTSAHERLDRHIEFHAK